MKKIMVFSIALLSIFFTAINLLAQEKAVTVIPRVVSYQGYVTDASKNPVSGNHSIVVKIYDDPSRGNVLHSENFSSSIDQGVFSVMIGKNVPLSPSLSFDKQYWLGVSVDGGAELSPRTAFTSVPYAIHSNEADALSTNATGAVRSINGNSGDFVFKGGPGTDIQTNGNTLTISLAPNSGYQTFGNGNVSGVIGTANQVLANGTSGSSQSGVVTLTTPQNIGTGSSPIFAGMTLTGKATAAATISSDPSTCLATKGYVDNAASSAWSINGNTGTNSNNYIGTSDATDVSFRTNATERMKLTSDGSLLLSGNSGSVPASDAGTRMMWIPSLGAFRAGRANGSEWNVGNVGLRSFGVGFGTLASGAQSVAMGYFTSAYGMGSTASGSGSAAYADGATAMGAAAQAVGFNSVALGDNTTAWGDDAIAFGGNTSASGFASMAMGYNTTTLSNYGTAMGKNLTVGLSSFGFNGSTTNTNVNISGTNNVAYFGDVDLVIGNDDNSARQLKFLGKNSTATPLSSAKYTSFKAGVQSANINYVLPTSQGAANSVLTNNGTGTLSWVAPTNSPYGSVMAGDEIDIPGNTNVVKIDDDEDNTVANLLVLPSGTNGQIMYIFNNDAEPTTGDAIIASGGTATFFYADGWHKTN